jgi:transcriptional regulator with XRE-family HTH domain
MVDFKAFRKANHLTQIDLADYLGVGQGFISQIEKGDRPMPKESISKILANPYGWDVSSLKDTQSRDVVVERQESKCETDIADRLLAIIEDQKKDIQMLLEMLRDKDYEIKRLRDELDESKKGIAPGADRSLSADAV